MTRVLFSLVALIALLLPVPAWSAADTPAQDLHFDSNGVKIRYTVQGEGEPVILVHGFTASVEANWGAPGVIAEPAKDFRVIALDARGHGKSGKPHDPAAYGVNMMEDVIRLMDHLGILKAHIAGYSMGGGITLQAITAYPDRFYCAILGGAGWMPPGSPFEGMMNVLADSLEQGKGLGPLIMALNPAGQPAPTAEQIAAINARTARRERRAGPRRCDPRQQGKPCGHRGHAQEPTGCRCSRWWARSTRSKRAWTG